MNDYILNLFNGDDELRPALLKPSLEGDFVYSTNGYALAKISKDKLKFKYEKREKFPDVSEMFTTESNPIIFSATALSQVISKMEFRYERKDCKECEGYGEKECHCCGETSDCKECDGSGESDQLKSPLRRVFEAGNYIKIGHRNYNPDFLNIILIGAMAAKEEHIIIENDFDDKKGCIFCFGDFKVLLMPINEQKHVADLKTF